eukprot:COSAG02_NODE_680_length_18551_cov_16.648060_14_plen_153_part_00
MLRKIDELELAVDRKQTRQVWRKIAQISGKRSAGQAMPSKDTEGNWLGDEAKVASFIARFWATKVEATTREAGRPEPKDLSPATSGIRGHNRLTCDLNHFDRVLSKSKLSIRKILRTTANTRELEFARAVLSSYITPCTRVQVQISQASRNA